MLAFNGYSQTQLSSEDAFIYFMKANGYKKGDNINNNSIAYGRLKWFDVYVQTYMKYQYSQSINDEFKKQKFISEANKRMNKKLTSVSFSTVHTFNLKGAFGQYDFSSGSFPISLSVENFKDVVSNAERLYVGFNSIVNDKDLVRKIKVSPSKAESIVNSRKKSNGTVNRSVYFKVFFNVTKIKPDDKGVNGYVNTDLNIYVHKVEVYLDELRRELLGTIKPSIEWEDNVNAKKTSNGMVTFENGEYLVKVKYENGKVVNPIKQYDKKGNLYMEGKYEYYNSPKDYKVADFSYITWFYPSGKVYVTAMFRNNKFYKERVEYYESGNIKDITYYKEDKKDGCSRQYTEDGQCKFPSIIYQQDKYFPFYNMGKSVYRNRQCGCDKPIAKYTHPSMNSESRQRASTITNNAARNNSRPLAWYHTDSPPIHSSCRNISDKKQRDICTKTYIRKAIENGIDYDKMKKNNIPSGTRISIMMEIDGNGKFINIRSNRYPIVVNEVKRILSNLDGLSGAIKDGNQVKVDFSFPLVIRY